MNQQRGMPCPSCGKRMYLGGVSISKFTVEATPDGKPNQEQMDLGTSYFCDRTPKCESMKDITMVLSIDREILSSDGPPVPLVQPPWPR